MNKLTDFCTRIFSGIFGNCVLEFLFLGYSTKNSSENPCMGQGCNRHLFANDIKFVTDISVLINIYCWKPLQLQRFKITTF